MKIGYARTSTQDQNLDLQTDALKKAGCKKIFNEKISGSSRNRPELDKLLEQLRSGDVVHIWKLDRLGRSLKDLISIVTEIENKGAFLVSLQDKIDTTTPGGRLIFHIFASLAEFERDVIRERTNAGLAAARARGRKGGRPKGLSKKAQDKAIIAETLYKKGEMTTFEICDHLSISRRTLYNYLHHRGVKLGSHGKTHS